VFTVLPIIEWIGVGVVGLPSVCLILLFACSRSATPAGFATARGGGRLSASTPTPASPRSSSSRRRRPLPPPPAPARRETRRRRSNKSPPSSSAWWASARRWCSSNAAGCAARSASARRRGRLCCSWRFPRASSTPPDDHSGFVQTQDRRECAVLTAFLIIR
jgi:hypothetical protein